MYLFNACVDLHVAGQTTILNAKHSAPATDEKYIYLTSYICKRKRIVKPLYFSVFLFKSSEKFDLMKKIFAE